MDTAAAPPDRAAARALAQEKLADRRVRLRRVRSGAVAGAVASFALAWGVIFGQLSAGNDPALAPSSTLVESTGTTTSSGDAGEADSSAQSSAQSESEPTPVTTSQS